MMNDIELRKFEQQLIRDAIRNKHHELSEDFLRPLYQYTSSEIRNAQRESWSENDTR